MTVYLADPDITLYHGDALETLRGMPDESVHCVVTSPPYWGLRDYGTGLWDGGDPDCDHETPRSRGDDIRPGDKQGTSAGSRPNTQQRCKCGAHRTDNQMGLEPTPELYVQNMVQVFREVRRVLRRDGTCWLNIGDSYNANQGAGFNAQVRQDHANRHTVMPRTGFKAKDLVGIPWMLAFALRADGWWLRADIIWAKPNPMPESVTDRPTKAHEYVFLLTRSPRYYWDAEAVRERAEYGRRSNFRGGGAYVEQERGQANGARNVASTTTSGADPSAGRNVRSVWEIATEPFPAAHFATFPTELARRCILAGTSERGCCPECGAPWEREVERETRSDYHAIRHPSNARDAYPGGSPHQMGHYREHGESLAGPAPKTLGWRPTCDCRGRGTEREDIGGMVPCTVLDPFAGACTVPLVARKHSRHSIGIELSETYLRQIALPRLQQLSLLAEPLPPQPMLERHRGLTGGAYSPPGQSPHSNARKPKEPTP